MTAPDLQAYIGIIEQLKTSLNSSNFEQMFSLLTADLPKSKQFILKMELKRIGQRCQFFIDLRGLVDGDVKPYPYQGKTHYMDENAIKVFEQGLEQYGSFTVGLYEEVRNTDNNFRVMHRKDTEKRVREALTRVANGNSELEQSADANELLEQPKIIEFGNYISRRDERMNFSIDVAVQTVSHRFTASTSDLSVSGCKIKVRKQQQAKIGQKITLFFTQLEQEFVLEMSNGVPYTIVDIEQHDQFSYWRMKRQPATDENKFSQFLQNFINGNKRRYKVNLDNVSACLLTKGYEQFYLPKLTTLPIFIAVRDNIATPISVLTTDHNKHCWQYFLDEQHKSVLISIINTKRLKTRIDQKSANSNCILYCFTHAVKGKLFYYSATDEELAQTPELRGVFYGFGSSKPSWRVFHFNFSASSAQFADPGSVLPQADEENTEQVSALVKGFIQDIRFMVSLTDITSSDSTLCYQKYTYQQTQLKLLAQFGHKKRSDIPHCEAVPMHYINLRAESRYLYKTAIEIQQADDMPNLTGFSRDFSAKGMQIETEIPVSFAKGDIILLNLPELQKISQKHQLSALAYEVMAVSKSRTIINLKVAGNDNKHSGQVFFQQLIKNNRSKLTQAQETPRYPGLSAALRNMYLQSQNNLQLFMQRKGIRYEINTVAKGKTAHTLHHIMRFGQAKAQNEPPVIELNNILRNSAASLQFAQQLKQMKRFEQGSEFLLFVSVGHKAKNSSDIECKYSYEFANEKAIQDYVSTSLQHGLLFCYRLCLMRTNRPDIEYFAKELNYISTYAIHKAKLLEEELWSVVGVLDVIDISAEIILRYAVNANPATIAQAKLAFLNS
ncbi:PilZ domain-containing protein [Rheinheimera salexigens]|uniref:PilZ domain-containing protein n=1 Tax=Rheinheimera salexigens TaxID=1628148 RepID=A0A1E7Q4W9_9GAMM|nr:PilZ domain-containing protein [Rheinheimera salexigens]OEY69186.1 PilZ domain-containing protein [Rheinheimera salexigens]